MTSWEERLAEAARGPVRLLDPLPWRTRGRLAKNRVIDRVAIWLVDHVHWRAGMQLWRACGMWRRRK